MSAPATGSRASRRLPIIVLVVVAVAAGVASGRSDSPKTPRPVVPVEATQLPAPISNSTAWYCPGLPAVFPTKSQTFTLSNIGGSAVRAAVTVHPDDGSEPVSHTVTVAHDSARTFDRRSAGASSAGRTVVFGNAGTERAQAPPPASFGRRGRVSNVACRSAIPWL